MHNFSYNSCSCFSYLHLMIEAMALLGYRILNISYFVFSFSDGEIMLQVTLELQHKEIKKIYVK